MSVVVRPNHDAGEQTALAVAVVGGLRVLLIVVAGVALDLTVDYARTFGALLADLLIAGLATGLTAHFSSRRWPAWQYVLVMFGYSLLIALLISSGNQSGS